ncbi:MAG: polyprenyl synthetase family protein [Verrucomicrobiota bacterium]
MDFSTKLNRHLARVEPALDALLPARVDAPAGPARIYEASRYSLQAGGKRIRPVLLLAAHELCAAPGAADPLPAAVALECVHTYSLVHDDLPCMDDDDLRRGRPTLHKQFDEATALLAGDALLTEAFALLARHYGDRPELAVRLVRTLADTASGDHLIGGQMQDLLGERKTDATPAALEFIHLNKTAAMIEAALVMGGLTGGADEATLRTLRAAGRHLGLAFQIVDDVLDATADQATLGKTPGKDAASGKTTYVSIHGLDTARGLAAAQTARAEAALDALPGDTAFLRELFATLLRRDS